jgi:cytochrome P450
MIAIDALPRVPGLPLLGNLLEIRRDRVALQKRIAGAAGEVALLRFPTRKVVAVTSPSVVGDVLVTHAESFHKSLGLSLLGRPLFGDGLLTSEGAHHTRQRRLMAPMFVQKRIAAFAATMVERAESYGARLRDRQRIDLAALTMQLTLEIVGKTLFDQEVVGDAGRVAHAVEASMRYVFGEIQSPVPLPPSVPTPRARAFLAAVADLDRIIYGMIADRRRENRDHGDLLSMLIAARPDEDEADRRGMTDREVRDELMTIFLAGHETTANALAWAFHLLGENPEARARLEAELDGGLGDRPPTLADLPKLPWSLAVVKESMRRYPPAYVLGRQAIADVEIGGVSVPKGTIVMINVLGIHHRADLFPEPEAFRPERFLGDAEKQLPRHAYMPFGAGPRICIGNHFALLEAQLLLCSLARHARFRSPIGTWVRPEPLITLRPRGGLPMIVERRRPAERRSLDAAAV